MFWLVLYLCHKYEHLQKMFSIMTKEFLLSSKIPFLHYCEETHLKISLCEYLSTLTVLKGVFLKVTLGSLMLLQ